MHSADRAVSAIFIVFVCVLSLLSADVSQARKSTTSDRYANATPIRPTGSLVSLDRDVSQRRLNATAAPDTTMLGYWTFDAGGSPTLEG